MTTTITIPCHGLTPGEAQLVAAAAAVFIEQIIASREQNEQEKTNSIRYNGLRQARVS